MLISKLPITCCILFLILIQLNKWVLAENHSMGTWRQAASAPAYRTEVAAAEIEGKIYVVGGFNKPTLSNALNFAISDTVEVYDTATNSWSLAASLPEGRHHAGVVSLDGFLYVIGGFKKSLFSVWHAVSTVYQYNPATGKWRELAAMPTARGALGVVAHQNRLYAIGGYDGKHNSGAVEIFDPKTNNWSPAPSMPTPRDHLAVVMAGGQIYTIGGRSELNYGRNMGTVEEYDPRTLLWRARTSLPTPRSGMSAAVVGDWIYVVGGESKTGTFATNEAYHPATDHWRTMTPMPTARHGSGSAVVNGQMYVISGGPEPGGSFSAINEVFITPADQ